MLSGTDLVDGASRRHEVLTLTPLAVAPAYGRRGIGSALVRAALAEAERRDEPVVVLEGSPDYYGRLGFEPASRHGISIDLPDWASPESAQVCVLSNYDPSLRGRVEYPPAIAAITE
jgi:putative acetyltransferase